MARSALRASFLTARAGVMRPPAARRMGELTEVLRAAETGRLPPTNCEGDTMSGELEKVATDFMAALDSNDVDRVLESIGEDAQGVDEISRRWLRGRGDLDSYVRQVMGAVRGVRSELRDAQERVWGDVGVLTCWLEQDYTFEGNAQHISAPTTIVLRREGGEWKIALFHSVPLPEQELAGRGTFAHARAGRRFGCRAARRTTVDFGLCRDLVGRRHALLET
jgi:ketosteroid isomerase-like protein